MPLCTPRRPRRGTILPLVTISLIAVVGFVALAVDVGLMMLAKNQCQAAADAAALAGARTLNGTSGGNTSAATTAAQNAADDNVVLGQAVTTADIPTTAVQHGAYHYDATAQTFSAQFPPVSPDNYNLTKATVTHNGNTAFARAFNLLSFQVSATATAAHRPRDVTLVLDFSGSMNDQSDVWNSVYPDFLSPLNYTSNNTDTVVPKFGHYSSGTAALVCTSNDSRVGTSNVTQAVQGEPAMVGDFYQNARGATSGTAAFTAATYPNGLSLPSAGDPPPHQTNDTSTTSWATNVYDILNTTLYNSNWETQGYDWLSNTSLPAYHRPDDFLGYTQGPGYWGVTFFIWPPDPRGASGSTPAKDWRQRFFLQPGGSYPTFGGAVTANTSLWDSSGNWLQPPSHYVINYAAILSWIKNCPKNPFPSVLRAGNVLYYDSIPSDVQSSAYDHTQLNNTITDVNQRFWKEYIDYVLGVWRDPFGNMPYNGNQSYVGYLPEASIGPDFTWGTVQISGKPGDGRYMDYNDNPPRPRHRFWFGPLTMIQFMLDTGILPGTAHDLSMVSAKLGITGALEDIQTNHPNDLVSLCLFSRPHYSGEPSEVGRFNNAQWNLSRDYAGMINAMWLPPNSGTTDVRPWDSNGLQTPRAHGDYTYNTATSYGLMLAYNQMSSSSALRTAATGGLGRKGAQRLIVLETDGMANISTTAGFSNNGAYISYYNIEPSDTVSLNVEGFGISQPGDDATAVATRLCALTTDTTNGPGFATPSKPVHIHCIAFGAIFEQNAAGTEAGTAMSLLQSISSIGGTGFPSSVTATSDPNFYKLCTGNFQARQDKLRTAFSKIMDDGITIILVQ